jgi:RNA polymerase sigma-70 factor (ECF subfamily)
MADFVYDPSRSFRAWLRTLAHHAWQDFVEAQQRAPPGSGDSGVRSVLEGVEARDDLLRHLEEEFDLELLEEAMAVVCRRVEQGTWEAFRLTALEGVPAAEVARRLNKRIATVYVARSKVQRMLQEEVERLQGAESARETDSLMDPTPPGPAEQGGSNPQP